MSFAWFAGELNGGEKISRTLDKRYWLGGHEGNKKETEGLVGEREGGRLNVC